MFVMRRLESVAEAVKLGESKEARKKILQDRLSEIVLPTTFKMPLNPHITVRTYATALLPTCGEVWCRVAWIWLTL